MPKKLIFLGNDGNLIKELFKINDISLIGIVADRVNSLERKHFGSAYLFGKKLGIPVIPQKAFHKDSERYLNTVFVGAEILLIQGYHYKIKNNLLKENGVKIINFHQSLLPYYAGRHPLNWMIINGEKTGGITFHYLNKDFDAGDIIIQKRIRMTERDNIMTLYNKTIRSAARILDKVFKRIYNKSFQAKKQNLRLRTYFPPRYPQDGEIHPSNTVAEIQNKIRALVHPYPGAFVYLNNKKIIIGRIRRVNVKICHDPDFITKEGKRIFLRASDGLLEITQTRNLS